MSAAPIKPLIGLTSEYEGPEREEYFVATDYSKAINAAGGLPFTIPLLPVGEAEDVISRLDGIILTGGPDVPAAEYGGRSTPEFSVVSLERLEWEYKLAHAALKSGIPIFGICLGHQLLNIMHGGTLLEDIWTQYDTNIAHSDLRPGDVRDLSAARPVVTHEVKIDRASYLFQIIGHEKTVVSSRHHQAVKTVGAGVKVVARAKDGIVEATEFSTDQFILSVQWHPELTRDQSDTQKLFTAFVEASRKVHLDAPVAGRVG